MNALKVFLGKYMLLKIIHCNNIFLSLLTF